jgi:hypothetical protein
MRESQTAGKIFAILLANIYASETGRPIDLRSDHHGFEHLTPDTNVKFLPKRDASDYKYKLIEKLVHQEPKIKPRTRLGFRSIISSTRDLPLFPDRKSPLFTSIWTILLAGSSLSVQGSAQNESEGDFPHPRRRWCRRAVGGRLALSLRRRRAQGCPCGLNPRDCAGTGGRSSCGRRSQRPPPAAADPARYGMLAGGECYRCATSTRAASGLNCPTVEPAPSTRRGAWAVSWRGSRTGKLRITLRLRCLTCRIP